MVVSAIKKQREGVDKMGDLSQGVQSPLEANAKCGFSFRRAGKALEDCVDDMV